MATYDLWQTAYVLGMQASGVQGQQGLPAELAARLRLHLAGFYERPAVIQAMDKWSTVWGPAIFEKQPSSQSYADNAMYVAANQDRSVYVVCIAGTNGKSKYDIRNEDFDVQNAVSWQAAFASSPPEGLSPYLAQGTVDGVKALLDLIDPFITRQTLFEFFKSVHSIKAQLIFSGHSLGAALAPALTLALFNPVVSGLLKREDWRSVTVYPTAGPTPGNEDLAKFFGKIFPRSPSLPVPDSYKVWNANVWNSLDVIPHSWELLMLEKIPTLYPMSAALKKEVSLLIDLAVARSIQGGRAMGGPYKQQPNQKLTGHYQGPVLQDMKAFDAELLRQHIAVYNMMLNVQGVMDFASPAAQ